ncbi:MAG: hypothetical protein R2745_14700 [Vicinamibacterales bacterium]
MPTPTTCRRPSILGPCAAIAALALSVVPLAAQEHGDAHGRDAAALVRLVRDGTRPYLDVDAAIAAGYGPSSAA